MCLRHFWVYIFISHSFYTVQFLDCFCCHRKKKKKFALKCAIYSGQLWLNGYGSGLLIRRSAKLPLVGP